MPRQPRIDLANIPQHVVQRGNDRQPCFFSAEDYLRYWHELREISIEKVHSDPCFDALFTQLNKDNNGGIGALMSATGYTLDQYAALAQADFNSGRPQGQALDVSMQNWNNQDALSFLKFNGQLMVMGGTGGLTAGLPLLAGAYEGTKVYSLAEFALASRAGAAATSATVNAASQYVQTGTVQWRKVVVSGATGYLGVGGNGLWNVAVNASGGAAQAAIGNTYYGENNNIFVATGVGAASGWAGFTAGGVTTNWLNGTMPNSLVPVIAGNVVGSTVSEIPGAAYQAAQKATQGGEKK